MPPPAPSPTAPRALLSTDRGVLVSRAPDPALKPGEAVLRITRIGLGSADVAIASGRRPFRGVMGRECVGIVERVDPRPNRPDDRALIGRRVLASPIIPCGLCDYCRSGLSAVCPQRVWPGARGRDGGASDFAVYPVAALHEVPRTVSDDNAALAPSLACALHAIQTAQIDAKGLVTILGDGVIAILAAQAAARINPHVRLLGRVPDKMALCERFGVKHRHVSEAGKRRDQHIVINCTNAADGLETAAAFIRPRGRIVTVYSTPPIDAAPAAVSEALADEAAILGAAMPPPADALATLAAGRCDTTGLVTRRFSLDAAPQALQAAADPAALKVIIEV